MTGATGLVGFELLELLRSRGARDVVGASRRGSETVPDVAVWDMSAGEPPPELRRDWDAIVNAAADTRWTQSPEEAERANVASVAALEPLVSDATHVIHVSTAYAIGLRGDIASPDLADYRNTYEWSKAHAERLAAERFTRLTIVRPPLIVGRRGDGHAVRFAGMYLVLRGITSSTIPVVVANADAYFDLIPVDDLTELIADLVAAPGEADGRTLTIAGGEGAPRVAHAFEVMVDALNAWRVERGHEPFAQPKLVTSESWNRFFLPFARDQLTSRQLKILELLENFQPYLGIETPLEPTHPVADMDDPIRASVGFWADSNERAAGLAPRPWKGD